MLSTVSILGDTLQIQARDLIVLEAPYALHLAEWVQEKGLAVIQAPISGSDDMYYMYSLDTSLTADGYAQLSINVVEYTGETFNGSYFKYVNFVTSTIVELDTFLKHCALLDLNIQNKELSRQVDAIMFSDLDWRD